MADFLLDDVGANPDLPFYRPRDFASRLGLRKTEFSGRGRGGVHGEHVPAAPPPVRPRPEGAAGGGARPRPAQNAAAPPHPTQHTQPPRDHGDAQTPIEPRATREGDTSNPDGSLTRRGADATDHVLPTGHRENSTTSRPEEAIAREPADRRAKNEKERSSIFDKASKGLMFLPLLLPLALLTAAVIQGEAECENVNSQTMDVINVVSAAWPQGLPSWVPQSGSTKYDIGYTPCLKILANDTLTFTDSSNTFPTGEFPIDSVPQPCYVRIDFGKELTIDPEVSNVATFKDKTSCADRMAYAAGQDVGIVANAAGEGLSGAASGLFGNINFGTIGMVLLAIVAVYFAIQFARQVI